MKERRVIVVGFILLVGGGVAVFWEPISVTLLLGVAGVAAGSILIGLASGGSV